MKWRRKIIFVSMWTLRLCCLFLAVQLVMDGHQAIRHRQTYKGLCPVEARVVKMQQRLIGQIGGVRTPPRPAYETAMELAYSVDGKTHTGAPRFFHGYRPWQEGQRIVVYYDPTHPSEFVLSMSDLPNVWTEVWLFVGLILIYALIEWMSHVRMMEVGAFRQSEKRKRGGGNTASCEVERKENGMKLHLMIMATVILCHSALAATITYTYDAQHRLVQASYSASEKMFYNYDAAGNVDQHVTITDAKYLESWLLYFSLLDTVYPSPSLSPWESALRTLLSART
jgi:YD repeat-containing protein